MVHWKLFFLLLGLTAMYSCKHHAKSGADEKDEITVTAFKAMFPVVKLPLQFGDSSLPKKAHDSALSFQTVRRFVPDSVFSRFFGPGSKPKCLAAGRVVVKKAETYLFLKASMPGKKALYIITFDKEDSFAAAMPLLLRDDDAVYVWTASVDPKYTITVNRQRRDDLGRSFYKKSVYVFNEAGAFTLIMMESNEEKPRVASVLNPIDTLSHKHKFTGDYLEDKRNFISFRDSRSANALLFFVHFEKDDGACKGELKGEAKLVSPNTARYSANGDPCSILFTFTGSKVAMKELEGCGSHRDIKCYFDGSYTKKEIKPRPGNSKPVHHKIK